MNFHPAKDLSNSLVTRAAIAAHMKLHSTGPRSRTGNDLIDDGYDEDGCPPIDDDVDCGLGPDGCDQAGTEYCEFDCPYGLDEMQ